MTDRNLAGKLLRILCPSCLGCVGGDCERCNGNGYVFKDPYALTSGEQGVDEDELDPPTPKEAAHAQ